MKKRPHDMRVSYLFIRTSTRQ